METVLQSTESTESFIYRLVIEEYPIDQYIGDQEDDSQNERLELAEQLGSGKATLNYLGQAIHLLPVWKRYRAQARQTEHGNRFTYLLTVAELNRRGLIKRPVKGEADYGQACIILIRHLTRAIEDIRLQGKIKPSHFRLYLRPLRAVQPDLYLTINEGIKLYFAGDYLPAAYILTLQIEDLLRHMTRLTGSSTIEKTRHGLAEKPLGRILIKLHPFLDENVYYYARWILKDYHGLNLRNAIAHGFFKKANTQPAIVVALIHLLCLLIANLSNQNEKD